MSDYQAAKGIHELVRSVFDASPKCRDVVNASAPKVVGHVVSTVSGSRTLGVATDASLTALSRQKPNETAEFLGGVLLIPVVVIASPFILAGVVLGTIFGDASE